MTSVRIQPARGGEMKLCRMLLGDAAATQSDYHLFVALDEASNKPVGAGSLRSGVEEVGEFWGVHLHVMPAFQGRGIEEELLGYALSRARAHGGKLLQTLRWLEQGSQEERQWLALGFTPHQTRYAHETDVAMAAARVTPLYEQVREHGWIPDDARTIPLAEADVARVLDLHLKYLGGSMRRLLPLLDGTASQPYDPQASMVLLCGNETMGFTLGTFPEPGVCEIAANVLHPGVRVGWANVLLKHDALQQVIRRGARTLRYVTMEKHTDSRRTGNWIGGMLTRTEVCLQHPC